MITKNLLREWNACWRDDRIDAYLAGREGVSPREVAADEMISLNDRLWVIGKSLWYLDGSAARGFAIETALTVAHLAGDEYDQARFHGLINDMLQIEDQPPETRNAACAAACAAARAAAWADARAAAWDAAIQSSISRALEWLGDYAYGWEE